VRTERTLGYKMAKYSHVDRGHRQLRRLGRGRHGGFGKIDRGYDWYAGI
jgi:hypothetical protein